MGVEISEIGAHQTREQRLLHLGDDPLADPGHQNGTAVITEALDDREGESAAGEQP